MIGIITIDKIILAVCSTSASVQVIALSGIDIDVKPWTSLSRTTSHIELERGVKESKH